MANIFIVHRWDGSPKTDWYPWLAKELTKKTLDVKILEMPHPETPTIEDWVGHLAENVNVTSQTFLIGHSIGCQTILRYLEGLPKQAVIEGVILVAGWLTLKNLEGPEVETIAKPWIKTPINFAKVRTRAKQFVYIYSDNDPYVDTSNAKLFVKFLNIKLVLIKGLGHFTKAEGVTKIPQILDYVPTEESKSSTFSNSV